MYHGAYVEIRELLFFYHVGLGDGIRVLRPSEPSFFFNLIYWFFF